MDTSILIVRKVDLKRITSPADDPVAIGPFGIPFRVREWAGDAFYIVPAEFADAADHIAQIHGGHHAKLYLDALSAFQEAEDKEP